MVTEESNRCDRCLQVFIPEVVPLDNKGEEAILRGLQDLLFPGQSVHFHILSFDFKGPRTIGNLTLYPWRWFYPVWVFRELFVSIAPLDLLNLFGFLWQGLRNRLPILARRAHAAIWFNEWLLRGGSLGGLLWGARKDAVRRLLKSDFILAGHDSAMGLREAHLLRWLTNRGAAFGVFGCGMNTRFANGTVASVYTSVFGSARFLYFRDQETKDGIVDRCGLAEARLAPDPAFAMHPVDDAIVSRFVSEEGLAGFFSRPVVMMTVVENEVILGSFKSQRTPTQKARAHYALVGRLVDHVVERWGANVLFLPHCVGPTARLDDRRIAARVVEMCRSDRASVKVLNTPCDARMLKGLIRRAHLLVAERIHSIIGAVGVGTPFLCLGNPSDRRTKHIIGKMCRAEDLVFDLSDPDPKSLCGLADRVWCELDRVRQQVQSASEAVREDLARAALVARASIAQHMRRVS